MFGGGDISTPEGFYQIETFGLMAPIAFMVVTVTIGARALAGEEANRTMGLLLANPIKRSTVVLEKTVAMIVQAAIVAVALFAGVVGGSMLGGLGMSLVNIAAATLLGALLGLVFGALALAISAATGRTRVAIYGTIGAALGLYVANGFLPFSDGFEGLAKWSPFHYYLSSDPLLERHELGPRSDPAGTVHCAGGGRRDAVRSSRPEANRLVRPSTLDPRPSIPRIWLGTRDEGLGTACCRQNPEGSSPLAFQQIVPGSQNRASPVASYLVSSHSLSIGSSWSAAT